MTVTIRDVAREAEVSVATVSRVLNGKGPAHHETERRIRRIAKRLRYVPHGAARSLITRRTNTFGVLLPDLYGEFFSEVIRGIDLCARRGGFHLVVSSSHSDRAETESMIRAMRGRVDGMIVLSPEERPPDLDSNLPKDFPAVLLNSAPLRGYDTIDIDNFGGAAGMARHLYGLGHRRIAFVCGPAGNRDASERLRGYRTAMRTLPGSEILEIPGDFGETAGYDACEKILKLRRRPTAIFAANDSMAIGLLCAFREADFLVPEDFAIAGFDDIPIARYVTPPLTTVRVPIAGLGERATRLLFEAVAGGAGRRRRTDVLPTALIVRESCGAAPARSSRSSSGSDSGSSSKKLRHA